MGITASQPMYAVEDVPGKGKGLVATKDISKGTRIISEKPIMSVSSCVANIEQLQMSIHQQVSSLREGQYQEFLSLDNIYPYTNSTERWHGIFRTNALPIGPDLDSGGIFFTACRINHACDNNAHNFWNENLNELTIHAARDICKGEEITIYYLGIRRNRQARQQELWQKFKFMCSCQLCSLPPDQSKDTDSKFDRIHELDCILDEGGVLGFISSALRMLGYVDEQVQLHNELRPDGSGLLRAYPDAFQIAIANGDLARSRIFAERMMSLYQTFLGDDSPDVIEFSKFVRYPSLHDYYGMSMQWKTALGEVPQGLGPEEFEDWLWRRKETTRRHSRR